MANQSLLPFTRQRVQADTDLQRNQQERVGTAEFGLLVGGEAMTSTLVTTIMQRADRVITLAHAIRHLAYHSDPIWSPQYAGDTDAIFIMQSAMDGPEAFVMEPRCEYPSPESTYGACDSLPCGQPADETGFCAKHRGEHGI